MNVRVQHTQDGEQVILALSRAELLLLAGSVNEAIEAVEDWEFSTRLGEEKSVVQQLRSDLRDVIAQLLPAP